MPNSAHTLLVVPTWKFVSLRFRDVLCNRLCNQSRIPPQMAPIPISIRPDASVSLNSTLSAFEGHVRPKGGPRSRPAALIGHSLLVSEPPAANKQRGSTRCFRSKIQPAGQQTKTASTSDRTHRVLPNTTTSRRIEITIPGFQKPLQMLSAAASKSKSSQVLPYFAGGVPRRL
jgi:hypothetical protein